MSTDDFVSLLLAVGPEVRQIYDEHLADFDEVLLHLLVVNVRDLMISAFDRGDDDLSKRLVAAFDTGLRLGDDRVVNAVAVSFVEDTPWSNPARDAFIASWPPGLRAEAEGQRLAGERQASERGRRPQR